jgi:hypothetical protein
MEQFFQPVPHRRDACAPKDFSHPKLKTRNPLLILPIRPEARINDLRILLFVAMRFVSNEEGSSASSSPPFLKGG